MLRIALAALLASQAIAATAAPLAPPPPEPDTIAETLFLIGDAGEPAKGGEPVLIALRRQLERAGSRSTVVFLGDNVYPAGLPAPDHPERAEMERRLDDQVDAVKDVAARVVFIPGNHDWVKGGKDGWEAVRRQERHIEQRGGPTVVHLPDGSCPGPEVVDTGERLRLVVLDTQWWLQSHDRPQHASSPCAAASEDEVAAGFSAALEAAGGRDVVVVTHHPLVSSGPHGGKFGLRQHLFPLTEISGALWVPLPLIGSIYPVGRGAGVSSQDSTSREYRRMRESLVAAARGRPPLAWAAGHEHVMEVIESAAWGRVLVSGAGIYGHVTYARGVEGSLYRAARAGFMRIDFLQGGRRRLGVIAVAADGGDREAYARILE
jgi:hypothetical protein